MSTHNIGFYEDLTKIIFELSSNITKYAPYFFCCCICTVCSGQSFQKLGYISVFSSSMYDNGNVLGKKYIFIAVFTVTRPNLSKNHNPKLPLTR